MLGAANPPLRKFSAALRIYGAYRAARLSAGLGADARKVVHEINMNEYLQLFLVFAQVGVCTFGGGYAMLPVLQREVVDKRGWCTGDELADYFAIGQCTPGVIAVNTATFVGSKRKGVPGGIIATLGMVFPSVVIITIIAAFLQNFAHISAVGHAFAGVRAAVVALIASSVLKLAKTTIKNWWGGALFAAVLLLSVFSEALRGLFPAVSFLFTPVTCVILAGIVGLAVTLAQSKKGGEPQ